MFSPTRAAAALCLLLPIAVASAKDPTPALRADQCGITTAYDVLVDSGGIWLRHGPQAPHEVFFHDGELSLDGKVVVVSEADAARLRTLESGARQLMPAATALAREAVELSFDALDGVYEIMTGTTDSRKVRKLRREAHGWVDGSLGKGYWEQATFGEGFDERVQEMAESLSGSLARSMLWQMATGRTAAIDARGDRIGKEMEVRLEARGQQMQLQADALCPLVQSLAVTHDALDVRYQGQPLQLLSGGGHAAQGDIAITPPASTTEKPRNAALAPTSR